MKYQVREFINEKYTKAVNILKDNLKENYCRFNLSMQHPFQLSLSEF